ncbi:MAG TPA: hypothetical protein VGW58_02965 [Pyrinomonadaceae bacterium]|nr:hypothetical protein [Pyrinomonadaceae bacterium]
MNCPERLSNDVIRVFVFVAVLCLAAVGVSAQSIDPNAPSPVRGDTLFGKISARDLGDARLTQHYYAFTGTPGDLLITVQTQNLNGDIDVFTAGTLRPLLKVTLYAESSAPVIKGIYLRKREDLILRIEARSPNDDEGTYRLVFGGSFEPIIGGPDIAENATPSEPKTETPVTGPRTKRVSSVGATIVEPEPPATAVVTPSPEPTPEPTPEAKAVESPTPAAEKPAETEEVKPTPSRTPRSRKAPPRTTTRRSTRPAPTTTETARTAVEEPKPDQPKSSDEPAREPEPEIGPRLVIETNDGTLVNRPMSGIKRVTVENGQVVVVGRDGKISRFLLADVVRMSISP